MKSDLDRRLLAQRIEKSSISVKSVDKNFLFVKTKSNLRPLSSSPPVSKVWEKNVIYFQHIHVENGQMGSHKLAAFLKYHMPLKVVYEFSPLLNIWRGIHFFNRVNYWKIWPNAIDGTSDSEFFWILLFLPGFIYVLALS